MSSTTTTKEKEKTYNSAIPNHFAVMCVMEDLIGSPDAESEEALIAARARAVGQLSGLANTMGRDWCENEIIPYLMRIALEDEKSVSIAATSQIADLCETKYFSKSVEMQESLILSVGVAFLTSAHLDVRTAAMLGIRRACLIFAISETKKLSSSTSPEPTMLMMKERAEREASQLVLRVVQRCLFDTAYPTSIASGLTLMSPASIQISAALPAFNLRPIPLLTQDALWIISQIFGAESTLTQLRLETAICGGSGRVTIIDNAIVALASNLIGSLSNNKNEIEEILSVSNILLNYLLEHVFSVNCPSIILLEESIPKLCSCLDSLRILFVTQQQQQQQSLKKSLKFLSLLFIRIIRDWSCCEDWGARFVLAKHSPQLFDSLLTIAELDRSKDVIPITFFELAMELLQRILPSLVNDDETEVNSAAAGSLPQLVSRFEKSPSINHNNNMSSSSSSFLIKGIFSSENEKFSQQLSVQEAVAASLGEAMKNVSENTNNSSNKKNENSSSSSLATTAQGTLSEMLATCQDDGVRVSIVVSLLWSSIVDAALHQQQQQNSSNNVVSSSLQQSSEFKQSLRNALDHLTDVPHSTATENPLLPQTTVTSWRIRETLGEATGKMLAKILLHQSQNQQQQRIHHQFSTSVVDFIVNPFVRLLFDRFFQVRSTSLSQLVSEFHSKNNKNKNHQKPAIPTLWDWILQFKPTAQRAPHYQTRVAYISAALVCASEAEAVQILENGARDKVANVRRSVAMALTQGCHNNMMMMMNDNNQNNRTKLTKTTSTTNTLGDENNNKNDDEKFHLIPEMYFSWSSGVSGRILDLLERLLSDESSDVREAAMAGLSRCS